MKNQSFSLILLALSFIFAVSFSACEDENDTNDNDDDFTEWEPYDLKANTAYDYDFEFTEGDEETSGGSVSIAIGDPDVEVSWNVGDQTYENTYDSEDNIEDNFIGAISQTPLAGFLYQPLWFGAFSGQEIKTGASWSYSAQDSSIEFEVTGTDTYAGEEGYVVMAVFEDESGATATWETCVSSDVPLPLMTSVTDEDDDHYFIELTNYEE